MPSNSLDAYGLMLSAIVDPNPVMVLLPKALAARARRPADSRRAGRRGGTQEDDRRAGRRPQQLGAATGPTCKPYFVPLGEAELVREGDDGHGHQLWPHVALVRAGRRRVQRTAGCTFDVLDLRSIFPYDWKAISPERPQDRAAC